MKQSTLPTIVIIITVLAALLLFVVSDHSGLSINECTFVEDSSHPGNYNLTYLLLAGRHFNHLECRYTLFDENNQLVKNGSDKLNDVHTGVIPVSNIISLTEYGNVKVSRAEITVFTMIVTEENGVNKTSWEKSFSKSFNL